MNVIGFDIGTTTICGVVIDGETGDVLESKTLPNESFLKNTEPYEKLQDPDVILQTALKIVNELVLKYAPIMSIGITGQMHGILYTDKDGNAISPLYTWQDGRGDLIYCDDKTYGEYLTEKTGYKMSTGFGITTHFYNQCNHLVPEEAVSLCTIHDYAAMKLTGGKVPYTSPSDAASIGCFCLEDQQFDLKALNKAGIDTALLPLVLKGYDIVGKTAGDIPVSIPIGDNQASVIGSVQDIESTLLVNIGTGSQVSVGIREYMSLNDVELRPCVKGQNIMVGSSLCGGRAYALLEQFFRKTAGMITKEDPGQLYDVMQEYLKEYYPKKNLLCISTQFSGTRSQPQKRGSITGIGLDNFTPEHFIIGTLTGIAEELYELYKEMLRYKKTSPAYFIGSGNAIRKNIFLQRILEEMFEMKLNIPLHKEEASYGAALFSMAASGHFKTIEEAQKIIKYL